MSKSTQNVEPWMYDTLIYSCWNIHRKCTAGVPHAKDILLYTRMCKTVKCLELNISTSTLTWLRLDCKSTIFRNGLNFMNFAVTLRTFTSVKLTWFTVLAPPWSQIRGRFHQLAGEGVYRDGGLVLPSEVDGRYQESTSANSYGKILSWDSGAYWSLAIVLGSQGWNL